MTKRIIVSKFVVVNEYSIRSSSFLAEKTKDVQVDSTIPLTLFPNNGGLPNHNHQKFVKIGMDAPLDILPNWSIDESKELVEDLNENVEKSTMQPHQLRTYA